MTHRASAAPSRSSGALWARYGPRYGRRALSWTLALIALSFVVWILPIRDRCWDPAAPASTRVAVTRGADRCTLHLRSGDIDIDAARCSRLTCEAGLASTFGHARLGVVAGLLALYAAGTLAWAARWRTLLAFAGVDLPLLRVWRISIEAQAGGILLPGGIGGDALRIASVLALPRRDDAPRSPASITVASVMLDRVVGLSVIAALAALLGAAVRGGPAEVAAWPLELALAAIPVAAVGALVVLRSGRVAIHPALAPVLAYLRDPRAPRAIARAAALSVVVASLQFAIIRGLVFAVGGVPVDAKWVYVGAAMAFIVAAVPALPGGWGTADAAYVFFFGLAGLSASTAVAVCLLFRVFWYLSGVAGALLHLMRSSGSARNAAPLG